MAIRSTLLVALACGASALSLPTSNKWIVEQEKQVGFAPVPREHTMYGSDWKKVATRRAEAVQALQNQSIVWYGDSLVEHWGGEQQGMVKANLADGPKHWKRFFVDRYGASSVSGIGGDRIANLLWRLQNGESPKKTQPRLIMLQIGSNDAAFGFAMKASENDADAFAQKMFAGIKDIVEIFDKESPHSQILLTAVMPRSNEWPKGKCGKLIPKVNKLIESLADQKTIHFSDCSQTLLKNGRVSQDLAKDFVHPGTEAELRWAECLQPTIDRILL